jgi:hypothetical protein
MRKITEIYIKYEIPENLRLHMRQVCAVTSCIIDNMTIPVDRNLIVLGALTHDLGNILKFDLSINYYNFDVEKLRSIQQKYAQIYGKDCDAMTIDILKKEGFTQDYINIVSHFSFKYLPIIINESIEKQILKYSDMRVGLFGIISLDERIDDANERYGNCFDDKLIDTTHTLEIQIFSHYKIKPEDITEDSIAPYIEKLKNFTL